MLHKITPGAIVLFDNGWHHSYGGRPHVVLSVDPVRGAELCPLSTTGFRQDPVIRRRPGGLLADSWACATDRHHQRSEISWASLDRLLAPCAWLNAAELRQATAAARRQLALVPWQSLAPL